MDNKFNLTNYVRQPPGNSYSQKVSEIVEIKFTEYVRLLKLPQSNIGPSVRFVRLLDVNKFKRVTATLNQISRSSEIFNEGGKLVVISSILVQFYFTDEFYFYPLML